MIKLKDLVLKATNVKHFNSLARYRDFCDNYLNFICEGLQARIVAQNENDYQFFQYGKDGRFNITRPINTKLFCTADSFSETLKKFDQVFASLKARVAPEDEYRKDFVQVIYTMQQALGATLDALPAGKSNQARKRNGDLFENLIRLLIQEMGVDCVSNIEQVPILDNDGTEVLKMSYQHDLVIKCKDEIKVIGSVKTSSKDRLDKIFMDKLLFGRLVGKNLPYIAIFLNDIQRKKHKMPDKYGVNSTFLSGHFKAYSIRLTPMDGVYYCDIRPNMRTDVFLAKYIKTLDCLFFSELYQLMNMKSENKEL